MKLPSQRSRVQRDSTPTLKLGGRPDFSATGASPQRGLLAHFSLLSIAWLGLAVGCAPAVDLGAVPQAVAECEDATDAELNPEATMLPGRDCMTCHRAQGFPTAANQLPDGQASRRAWTAAGTVFDSPTAKCNSQGLEGVKVEIADSTRKVLITLYTNRVGNFFTSEPINFSGIIARVSKDGKIREMQGIMASADCPSCHRPTGIAGGRIYLN